MAPFTLPAFPAEGVPGVYQIPTCPLCGPSPPGQRGLWEAESCVDTTWEEEEEASQGWAGLPVF